MISRNLLNTGLNGNFLQVKVEMETTIKDISPMVTNVTLKYSSRNSSYFFTTKFTLDQNSEAKSGLLTANISQPINTEIQFGVSDKDSADWNDYIAVQTDKFFDLNNKNVKIGIKFTSYDESIPEVAEFALMAGDNNLKRLNE